MSTDPLIARIRALCTPLTPEPTDARPELGPLDGIRAVLFDIYGTLLISASGDIGLAQGSHDRTTLGDLFERAELAAPAQDEAAIIADALIRDEIKAEHAQAKAQGIDYPEVDILLLWQRVLGRLGIHPEAQQVRRLAVEYESRSNTVWPMPGVEALLRNLLGQGLVLGVVSNAQFYTPLVLEAFFGQPPAALGLEPECSAWSYRLAIGKPSRAIYRPALDGLRQKHGIEPAQVLYIGNDRRNDIWPASALGMRTALFAGDARSLRLREDDPNLTGVKPDRVVTALDQVPQLLAKT
jgi:putative hydrolase of the HAD superfamily